MLSKCLLNVVQRKKKIVSGPLLITNLGDMNLQCGVMTVHMGKEELIFCSESQRGEVGHSRWHWK